MLMSPWTDLSVSSPSYERMRQVDPCIDRESLGRSGLRYAGQHSTRDPIASPLFADPSGLPPLLIHVGGDETMLDDSRLFAERAKAAGVEVTYTAYEGMWHVHHSAAPEVPEAMWQLSLAFVQLHFCTDARSLLGDLVKRYPKSPRSNDAKAQLKTIAKLPKASCTS